MTKITSMIPLSTSQGGALGPASDVRQVVRKLRNMSDSGDNEYFVALFASTLGRSSPLRAKRAPNTYQGQNRERQVEPAQKLHRRDNTSCVGISCWDVWPDQTCRRCAFEGNEPKPHAKPSPLPAIESDLQSSMRTMTSTALVYGVTTSHCGAALLLKFVSRKRRLLSNLSWFVFRGVLAISRC